MDPRWEKLKLLREMQSEEEDQTGNIKNAEGRSLLRQRRELERQIGNEAYKILRDAGYTGTGQRSRKKR